MEPIAAGAMRFGGKRLLDLQSDEQLARLAAAGLDEAFAALVRRYRAPLERACQRILSDGQAEDAVQQTFLNAHRALSANGAPGRVRPWLYRIAINAALKLQQDVRTVSLDVADVAAATSVDEDYESHERLEATLRTIGSLPERQRQALLMREMEGRTHEEIAAQLGLSGGAIRQLIYRARDNVRAAATALTPSPLLARLLGGEGADAARQVAEAATVGGAGLAAKAAVATVVAGGVAGGLAVSPLDDRGRRHAAPESAVAAAADSHPDLAPAIAGLAGPVPPTSAPAAAGDRGSRSKSRRAKRGSKRGGRGRSAGGRARGSAAGKGVPASQPAAPAAPAPPSGASTPASEVAGVKGSGGGRGRPGSGNPGGSKHQEEGVATEDDDARKPDDDDGDWESDDDEESDDDSDHSSGGLEHGGGSPGGSGGGSHGSQSGGD